MHHRTDGQLIMEGLLRPDRTGVGIISRPPKHGRGSQRDAFGRRGHARGLLREIASLIEGGPDEVEAAGCHAALTKGEEARTGIRRNSCIEPGKSGRFKEDLVQSRSHNRPANRGARGNNLNPGAIGGAPRMARRKSEWTPDDIRNPGTDRCPMPREMWYRLGEANAFPPNQKGGDQLRGQALLR